MSDLTTYAAGGILTITINAPQRLNALTIGMIAQIHATIAEAQDQPAIRAIVLTGAGRGFCTGAALDPDADLIGTAGRIGDDIRAIVNPLILLMRQSQKPIVAAVNGPAAGFGVGLALAADIVIASETAKFALSFVKIGASLDGGTSLLVPSAIGPARARALALLGDAIDASTAAAWGLIWRVVEGERLMEEALAIAQRLAAGPGNAITAIKRLLCEAESGQGDLAAALEREAVEQEILFSTNDFAEGVAAFQQRRTPRFGP